MRLANLSYFLWLYKMKSVDSWISSKDRYEINWNEKSIHNSHNQVRLKSIKMKCSVKMISKMLLYSLSCVYRERVKLKLSTWFNLFYSNPVTFVQIVKYSWHSQKVMYARKWASQLEEIIVISQICLVKIKLKMIESYKRGYMFNGPIWA